MPYSKHEQTGRGVGQRQTEPKISLRKSQSIGINRAAMEEYFEDAEAAVLYFDEDQDRVAIRPLGSKDEDDDAYTITQSDGSGSVAPGSFFNRNQLTPEVTEQYSPELESLNDDVDVVAFTVGQDSDNFIGTYGSPDTGDSDD